MGKIANVTCMLQELKGINQDKTPNYVMIETHINGMDDAFLKDQLLYGMDMCRDYANCMPVKKAKNPMLKELGTYIFFQKCMEMQKVEACFKKDFRYMMGDYGFDVVEERSTWLLKCWEMNSTLKAWMLTRHWSMH